MLKYLLLTLFAIGSVAAQEQDMRTVIMSDYRKAYIKKKSYLYHIPSKKYVINQERMIVHVFNQRDENDMYYALSQDLKIEYKIEGKYLYFLDKVTDLSPSPKTFDKHPIKQEPAAQESLGVYFSYNLNYSSLLPDPQMLQNFFGNKNISSELSHEIGFQHYFSSDFPFQVGYGLHYQQQNFTDDLKDQYRYAGYAFSLNLRTNRWQTKQPQWLWGLSLQVGLKNELETQSPAFTEIYKMKEHGVKFSGEYLFISAPFDFSLGLSWNRKYYRYQNKPEGITIDDGKMYNDIYALMANFGYNTLW